MQRREWRPDWPCPVGQVLAPYRHGGGDPTFRRTPDGGHARGLLTPVGPATLVVRPLDGTGRVVGEAEGPGADWALEALPGMLGAYDDPAGFEPPPVLRDVWRRHRHWRIGRSGLVMESLVPAIIEQKVTGQEAFAGYRRLVRRFGSVAPGRGSELDLWVPPGPVELRAIPSWEWLRLPIDAGRSRPLLAAAAVASSLERLGGATPDALDKGLRSLPGIGVWTSAEVRSRVLGDADSVSFGDYHVAKNVGWVLTGEEVDDDGLAALLEPYRPHRHRVQRLVELARLGRPRRGPRLAPRTHLP